MKVLLVSSNLGSQFRTILPNGAVSLSAYLKRYGVDVRVAHIETKGHRREYARTLTEYRPDVVGISATVSEAAHIPTFAKMAKNALPNVPVLAGGIHPTLVPDEVLALEEIDAVCVSEGEEALLEYVQTVESGGDTSRLRGFWVKQDGEIIKNETRPFSKDLDALPFMDRDAIDYQRHLRLANYTATTMVGRGCIHDCTFCANRVLRSLSKGPWVRNRSVDNALDDLAQFAPKYDFNYVCFRDDNFTWNKAWLMEFCDKYPQRFDYEFDCFSRCDTIEKEMMDALKAAGCRNIFIGLDSGNDYIRNDILCKHTTNESLIEASRYLNSIGIKACISNIVGLPYETRETFQDTIDVNKEIHKDQVVFTPAFGAAPKIWIFNPFPGTPLFKLATEKGWLKEMPHTLRIYRETYIDMPQFKPKEIDRAWRTFRYLVYKDNHLFWAWVFRAYDSRIGEFIMEALPSYWLGQVRQFFANISRWIKPRSRRLPAAALPGASNPE